MWLTHESAHVSAPLKTIENAHPELATHIEHIVGLPILCNKSQNPAAGSTLTIAYTAGARILELFALEAIHQGLQWPHRGARHGVFCTSYCFGLCQSTWTQCAVAWRHRIRRLEPTAVHQH